MTEVLWASIGGIIPPAAGNLGRFSRGGSSWTFSPRMCKDFNRHLFLSFKEELAFYAEERTA